MPWWKGLLPASWRESVMLLVLLALVAVFSVATLKEQTLEGEAAAHAVAPLLEEALEPGQTLVVVAKGAGQDAPFLATLQSEARRRGLPVDTLTGSPRRIREGLGHLAGSRPQALLTVPEDQLGMLRMVLNGDPALSGMGVITAPARRWPTFLLRDNLLNVANQIAVIAIVAIGMTLVILTAGIDLSVGSLIALSAVVCAQLIERWGAEGAGLAAMLAAGGAAMVLTALLGALSGLFITRWRVPPFIATLGMMQVASGLAYILSQGRPVYRLPASFTTLGRGADPLLGLPWAVLLMLGLYALAHLFLSRTVGGRHVYAVGGNAEAARLAGVSVKRVLGGVYAASGLLAGLGGVLMASQLKSGAPTYGGMYELYVIAAVVVGGASLSGGQGRMTGTLTGAFIMAVIQNGMNLSGVESYTQKIVLGLVILGAVLIERINGRQA